MGSLLLLMLLATVGTSTAQELPNVSSGKWSVPNWVRTVNAQEDSTRSYIRAAATSGGTGPRVVVDCKGSSAYKTVTAGILGLLKMRKSNQGKPVMYIKNCVYREKIVFPKRLSGSIIKGESAEGVILQWGDTAATAGSTLNSASSYIKAGDLIVIGITFKNTAPPHANNVYNQQGVALVVKADKVAFFGCRMLGFQDTLYDKLGRHYFKNCYIEGAVDFIFGDGQSIYEYCSINSPFSGSTLVAQSRAAPGAMSGFVFLRCKIRGNGLVRLARAWGVYSRVIFAYCNIDATINSRDAYNDFGFFDRRNKVYFGEYKNTGPGAVQSKRNSWAGTYILSDAEARPFVTLGFINFWLPSTSPPNV